MVGTTMLGTTERSGDTVAWIEQSERYKPETRGMQQHAKWYPVHHASTKDPLKSGVISQGNKLPLSCLCDDLTWPHTFSLLADFPLSFYHSLCPVLHS